MTDAIRSPLVPIEATKKHHWINISSPSHSCLLPAGQLTLLHFCCCLLDGIFNDQTGLPVCRFGTDSLRSIVGDYLSALSYSEIGAKNHVSTGTVANVVADLKAGRFPEAGNVGEQIEQLKELSLDLKRANLSPGKCAVGLMVLARINECGLDPADIDRWPLILKSVGNEDEAQEFVRLTYSIQEVQKRTGLNLDGLHDKVHCSISKIEHD